MPPTSSSANSPSSRLRRVAGAALVFASASAWADPAPSPSPAGDVLPVPAAMERLEGRLPVTPAFRVFVAAPAESRVPAALSGAMQRWSCRTGLMLATAPGEAREAAALVIEVQRVAVSPPRLGEDESYDLEIGAKQAVLRAATDIGALRGLETLLQLLAHDGAGYFLPALRIHDEPRFPWRGLMIDVARHWQPIEVIQRNLDGMALVKLNVLHLHLTDDQGFRVESKTHPELQEQGSDGRYFTQAQIREIIAYASARGIRVVPEFDIPGHATSWVVSHPELASQPGPYAIERKWGVFDPVLDPTNEQTYALLADFLGEMAALFPDDYLHIGGDENNGVQWNANPRIQAYIREHHLKDNEGLHAYFNGRVSEILRQHGKRLVGWDEILHPDLPKDSVIHSWRGAAALAEAARRGYSGLLSNGYYIDLNHPASEHYLNDPLPAGTNLTAEEQRRILGGEATMWAEWVTPDLIDTRIWPRTAAIAERLWSLRDVTDLADMYRRLAVIDTRLREAGLQQGNWPRIALPAVEPEGATAHALRVLAAAVEPVKNYQRGQLQPESNQRTPLEELADWARPDSASAREFTTAVDRWLFGGGELDAASARPLVERLNQWHAAGVLATAAPMADTPVAQARGEVAARLVAISEEGLRAVAALTSRQPLTPAQFAASRAALDTAAQPNAAAVEFPFLGALQWLAAAAAEEPARRDGLSPDAWRRQLEARMAPTPAKAP